MKKANDYILVLFFLVLCSVPTFWLLRGRPESNVSMVEGRVLGLPERSYPTLKIALDYLEQGNIDQAAKLVWDLYTGGSLQRKFDGAATDQFPFRIPLIRYSKAVDRQIINLVYSFTDDNVIPADMTSDIYVILEDNALIFPPFLKNDETYKIIDERVKNYNQIAYTHPEINFYLFYLETLEYSPYNPLIEHFPKADLGESYNYFQENISSKIVLENMVLENLDDHIYNFYRTDHHWNIHGILKGYEKVYQMLSLNYPDIPEMFQVSGLITFSDIEFLGTLARRTLYPIEGDEFTGFLGKLPSCVVSDQEIKGDYDYRDEYHKGQYSTQPFTRHYGLYFGSQSGLLEYDCEIGKNRNIIIIGNSYIRPLVPLIASHYDHTYFLDLRQNETFSLSNFLVDHPVDDILIAGNAEVFFGDDDLWMINP